MNTSSNHILDTIISEVNSINEKIKGLNFLEILKNNLIEKILDIDNQNTDINELDQIEKEVNSESRDIKINIKFLKNSSIISKKSIEENTLFYLLMSLLVLIFMKTKKILLILYYLKTLEYLFLKAL